MQEPSERATASGDRAPAPRLWGWLAVLAGVVNGAVLLFGPDVDPPWQFARIAVQLLVSTVCLAWGLRQIGLLASNGPRRHQTVRFTLPAYGAFLIMAVLFAGSMIGRSNPLMLVASMICGPFVLNGWLANVTLRRLRLRRRVPARALAGQPVWVEVEAVNENRVMNAWLVVLRDDIETEDEQLVAEVPMLRLPCRTPRTNRYQVTPMRRGRYRFGPLSAKTSFPFGFVERTLVVEEHGEMLVHPRIGRLTRNWRRPRTTELSPVPAASSREGMAADEFQKLREYRYGDSPRHVHWRSSARRGELLVKDVRSETAAPLAILVDLWQPERPDESDRERVELAVSLVATLCVDELNRHRETTLDVAVSSGDLQVWEGRSGPAGVEGLLDELAVVQGSPRAGLDRLVPALEDATASRAAVLLVTTRPTAELQRLAGDLPPDQRRLVERARILECSPERLQPVLDLS